MDTVETEPQLEASTQHVAGRLVVPSVSSASKAKVLMGSGSGITAMSEDFVEALQAQPRMIRTTLTLVFVEHARVVTSLGQESDSEPQSCPPHLATEIPWTLVRFTMPFIVVPGGGDVVFIGPKTLKENIGINVMAQVKASVLKDHGRLDGAGMELKACAVGEPNAGAVLRAALAVAAFGPGGDAPGDVDDDIMLTLPSPRPMMLQHSEAEMHGRVGELATAVDDAVDLGLPPECAKMLRDTGICAHVDVFRRALLDDPPARVEIMAVRIRPGARVVWAKPPPEYKRLPWNAAILPRLPLGGDDDRRRGVLGRIGGGVEHLAAGVAHLPGCPGRAAKELKSLRLKAEQRSVLVQRLRL